MGSSLPLVFRRDFLDIFIFVVRYVVVFNFLGRPRIELWKSGKVGMQREVVCFVVEGFWNKVLALRKLIYTY